MKNKNLYPVITPMKVHIKDLFHSKKNLIDLIHSAFGLDGIGLLVVKGGNIFEMRENLLQKAFKLSQMDKAYLQSLERPDLKYIVGWNMGKAHTEGKYEKLTGAFYANITNELNKTKRRKQVPRNIWPSVTNFRSSFLDMGEFMINCQMNLLPHLDRYIFSKLPNYPHKFLTNSFFKSYNVFGRLIISHPLSILPENERKHVSHWQGWHRDFGLLTALLPPMYVNPNGKVLKGAESGLLVLNRKGKTFQVSYENDEIAIQLGDLAFLLSGGFLASTPHAVSLNGSISQNCYRINFVTFFDPENEYRIELPKGISHQEILRKDPFQMKMSFSKYQEGWTYRDMLQSALQDYYPKTSD